MPSPEASEVEIVRQIVAASSLSEVRVKIEALADETWDALKEDLPLWNEYRYENETKSKLGEIASETDPVQTRLDYRNSYCATLGYPVFNRDGSRGTQSATNPFLQRSRAVKNRVQF